MIRFFPYSIADGAANMAADEAMVRSAADGSASIRFYGWDQATVSLGYFQPNVVRLTDSLLAPLPWVRRPSGGATLVHHHELTYAIALPPGIPWHSREPWMTRMHRIITRALAELGLPDQIQSVDERSVHLGDVLCFQQQTPGDLTCLGSKVVGSAQRKYRQALMQHGSILLAQSEYTPALPGLRELTGVLLTASDVAAALVRSFAADTGWRVIASDWTAAEKVAIRELTADKYESADWNLRR